MKLTLLLGVITTIGYSQAGAKWATGGNASSTGEFFGTTTNFPIDFKTNNVLRATLSTTGVFKINSLAGVNTRLLQTDANGNIIFLPQGSPSQVLYGNGTWGALPVYPVIWQQAGSKAYYNNGFVGIGTNNPQVALDVVGDVKVSNNLYVGGGILISQKVEASSSMKTDTVHSASGETKFTSKLMLLDKIQVEGATLLKSQFQVNGTSLFNGTVQANNLNVSGVTNFGNNAIVNGVLTTNTLNVNGAFMANTLRVGDATNNADIILQVGANNEKTIGLGYIGTIPSGPVNSCVAPYHAGMTTGFKGRAVITTVGPTDPIFDFRNDGFNGSIDYGFDYVQYPQLSQRTGPTNIPSIKINGSCWGDVELAKGGGFVSTGNHFEVGNPVSSYIIASNIKANNRIGQRVTLNTNIPDAIILLDPQLTNYNTQLFVNKNLTRAISVFNTITNATGDEVFTVFGDGSVTIKDIASNKVNFSVKPNGYVYAREINVMPTTITFPDYVFAKNYKLMPLAEVENYVTANKHLPNIPSAKEVETNGINLADLQIKQMEKIEELYLHLIELKKENEALKTRIESLEKK